MLDEIRKVPSSSNSRYASQNLGFYENLTIDRIVITGDLTDGKAHILNDVLLNEYKFDIKSLGSFGFAANTVIGENIRIEYDDLKAKSRKSRNTRIEFNPSKVSCDDVDFIRNKITKNLEDIRVSRLDIAIDFRENLSKFTVIPKTAKKQTIITDACGNVETRYIGARTSSNMLRIYNKAKEIKDKTNENVEGDLWRVEFELKQSETKTWETCCSNYDIIFTDYEDCSFIDRCILEKLEELPEHWGNLTKNTRTKYRKLMRSKATRNLTDEIKEVIERNKKAVNQFINKLTNGH